MVDTKTQLLAAGGCRHPSAADWDPETGILAYASSCNVALWEPRRGGVTRLVKTGSAAVNAVRFVHRRNDAAAGRLVAGSADGNTYLVRTTDGSVQLLPGAGSSPPKSVNAYAAAGNVLVSASASGVIGVWDLQQDVPAVRTSISLKPTYIPLTLDLFHLGESNGYILAVGGTRNFIQIYTLHDDAKEPPSLAATLTGHEGWIRSLSFTRDGEATSSDILLASASQDKYIRLWRLHQGLDPAPQPQAEPVLGSISKSLSNKAHRFTLDEAHYSLTFEALLLGHEDWIYTTQWHRSGGTNRLLSASADNSLSIWQLDASSGVWVSTVRLGEISQQKGATTATGSTGGFWVGLWSPDGTAVASLGRTGSWRLWAHDQARDIWVQEVGVSGHTKAAQDIVWSRDGAYLISTSADQTTRIFAEWTTRAPHSWHELSRAQIHGYDLNCVASLTPTQFISGADEKLLRVFDQPGPVALLLSGGSATSTPRPDVASIPVLGLSNKSIEADAEETPDRQHDASRPPTEDQLARHLLWPETEKLYGHGYEISCVAVNHAATYVASACRAASLDHAVIRLHDTSNWRQLDPALKAHALTVTRMEFSPGDEWLLSVSRDRSCCLFKKAESGGGYVLAETLHKAHSRMILDCAWARAGFVTASRDKSVGVFRVSGGAVEKAGSIQRDEAVTAVHVLEDEVDGQVVVALGMESGAVSIARLDAASLECVGPVVQLDDEACPAKLVTRVRWRPGTRQLGVASEDGSVRVLDVRLD